MVDDEELVWKRRILGVKGGGTSRPIYNLCLQSLQVSTGCHESLNMSPSNEDRCRGNKGGFKAAGQMTPELEST